jgi:hypothetical protein
MLVALAVSGATLCATASDELKQGVGHRRLTHQCWGYFSIGYLPPMTMTIS